MSRRCIIGLFSPRVGGDQDDSGPERVSPGSVGGSEPVKAAAGTQGCRHRGRDGNDELAPQKQPRTRQARNVLKDSERWAEVEQGVANRTSGLPMGLGRIMWCEP
jgi:hypothetical protein